MWIQSLCRLHIAMQQPMALVQTSRYATYSLLAHLMVLATNLAQECLTSDGQQTGSWAVLLINMSTTASRAQHVNVLGLCRCRRLAMGLQPRTSLSNTISALPTSSR